MLDALSQLKQLLTDVQGLNASNAAPLADMRPDEISTLLSGKRPVTFKDAKKIEDLCRFVREIEAAFSPVVPLNWKNTAAIRKIKDGLERGELYIRIIQQTSETEVQ